jgi:hypothetical protein
MIAKFRAAGGPSAPSPAGTRSATAPAERRTPWAGWTSLASSSPTAWQRALPTIEAAAAHEGWCSWASRCSWSCSPPTSPIASLAWTREAGLHPRRRSTRPLRPRLGVHDLEGELLEVAIAGARVGAVAANADVGGEVGARAGVGEEIGRGDEALGGVAADDAVEAAVRVRVLRLGREGMDATAPNELLAGLGLDEAVVGGGRRLGRAGQAQGGVGAGGSAGRRSAPSVGGGAAGGHERDQHNGSSEGAGGGVSPGSGCGGERWMGSCQWMDRLERRERHGAAGLRGDGGLDDE